jgi:flagellar basal body-associated protein FliL
MKNNIKTWIIVFVIFLIASCISFFVMIRGHSDKNPGAYQKALEQQKKVEEKIKNQEETANWKTYRNTKYGYEIKYPEDWNSPIESGDTDALTTNYAGFFKGYIINFSINVYENDKNLSLENWWEQEFYDKFTVKYEYSYEGIVSISPVVEALKYKIQRIDFEDNCYLISRNQRVYTIYFSVLPGSEEILQILSTFKFLQ